MTIIVFLIDTSASMNQRAYYSGTQTLLDVAKSAVEMFFKTRQKSFESRGDRYMLLDFEDPPANIKAGWKENLATFMNELRNLECNGLTLMGSALKNTFDLLNLNRMQTGIDTYGQGRCPFYLEPSVIIVITDGGKLLSNYNVTDDFNLPMHSPIPGSELTREPFRWDQRLFALVLRMTGPPSLDRDTSGIVPNDLSPIDAMCEVTGGRSFCVTSKAVLNHCVESLCQKLMSGVVINFEKSGPDPPPVSVSVMERGDDNHFSEDENELKIAENPEQDWGTDQNSLNLNRIQSSAPIGIWQNCRKMIYVSRSSAKGFAVGFWPIPEAFWPELLLSQLPPRSAHPVIKFTCVNQEPLTIENLPFDKYELEPSSLTRFIIFRKQPTVCWQVFVTNSYKNSEIVHPFGYLKASTNLTCVNLFVMPYNYPVLLPLLDDLFKVLRLKPTQEWRNSFQNYLKTMPAYYAGPLRRALVRMGVPNQLAQTLIPEQTENSLSYTIVNYLKRIKSQAKIEFDRLCNEVQARQAQKHQQQQQMQQSFLPGSALSTTARLINRNPFTNDLLSHPILQSKFAYLNEQLNEFNGFAIGIETKKSPSVKNYSALNNYRNPFDIHRNNLKYCVKQMRRNFMQTNAARIKLFHEDFLHSMPVSQMGNYQEYLKRQAPPLREIESVPVRQHMFGNPFKIDKRMMMMVDEADIDNIGNTECPVNNATSVTAMTKTGANATKGLALMAGQLKRNNDMTPAAPMITSMLRAKRKQGPLPKDFTIQKRSFQKVTMYDFPSDQSESDAESDAGSDIAENAVKTGIVFRDIMSYNNVTHSIDDNSLGPDFYPRIDYDPNIDMIGDGDSDSISSLSNCINVDPPALTNQNENILFDKRDDKHYNNKIVKKKKKKKIENNLSPKDLKLHNLNVRKLVFKHIRRPGQDFTLLFDQLKQLKGSIEMQIEYLHQIIEESKKFKRKKLVLQLEQFMKTKLVT